MELTITPEVEALLQREMETGRFEDPNALIETALHLLSDSRPHDLKSLDAMIQEGIDSADRGELFTEEETRAYIADIRAKL